MFNFPMSADFVASSAKQGPAARLSPIWWFQPQLVARDNAIVESDLKRLGPL